MGAWGIGNLENDDAVEWLIELEADVDASIVREALATAADAPGYIESPDCCIALAAAELVAAALGRPPLAPENPTVAERLPELAEDADDATQAARDLAEERPELVDDAELARRAVANVCDPERSELYGLMTEQDGSPRTGWNAVVADLRQRLGA